jgi:hypothetical protein
MGFQQFQSSAIMRAQHAHKPKGDNRAQVARSASVLSANQTIPFSGGHCCTATMRLR